MPGNENRLECRVKAYRLRKGWSQAHLAELVGVKRQAIYDIESGKYAPNTALALRLARHLECRVEDLFSEEASETDLPVSVVGEVGERPARVALARVRGRVIAYPLGGQWTLQPDLGVADGLVRPGSDSARLLTSPEGLDRSIILLGCDPAFAILKAQVERATPELRVHCLFASSRRAVEGLCAGEAHIAGTHFHNAGQNEANVQLAKGLMAGNRGVVVGFSQIEEGLIVARGNPLGIRSVADLAGGPRLVNREPGAALRGLLDDQLGRQALPAEAVVGYGNVVRDHLQGVQRVLHGQADVALGFRAVAEAWGLDFVPIALVRCDLVAPLELTELPSMAVLLDILQTRRLRDELGALPGYEVASTGSVITEF